MVYPHHFDPWKVHHILVGLESYRSHDLDMKSLGHHHYDLYCRMVFARLYPCLSCRLGRPDSVYLSEETWNLDEGLVVVIELVVQAYCVRL